MSITLYILYKTPKLVFVQSTKVIENYIGMKEVQDCIQKKTQQWNTEIDTLEQRYNQARNYLENNSKTIFGTEKTKAEQNLWESKNNFERYSLEVEKMVNEETERLMQGALNQINSFVENYAKENNIDLVIGVTLSGNVLYGNKTIDVTDEIISGLNEQYKK